MEEIKEQIVERQQNQSQIGGTMGVTDSKLYRNFWNLQKYLANPLSIFTSKQLDFEVLEE